ncbi:MAG: hypothetical protein HYY35_01020 [Deltaproteobacteria bacterium]|nr:hypothetical protein [Deltaproteobacteria bacterium]
MIHLIEEAAGEVERLAREPRVILALDFDGTLAPLVRLRARLPRLPIGAARVEDKVHSITLHVRGLPPDAAAVARLRAT